MEYILPPLRSQQGLRQERWGGGQWAYILMTSISSPCFPEMDSDFLFMLSEWYPQPEYCFSYLLIEKFLWEEVVSYKGSSLASLRSSVLSRQALPPQSSETLTRVTSILPSRLQERLGDQEWARKVLASNERSCGLLSWNLTLQF